MLDRSGRRSKEPNSSHNVVDLQKAFEKLQLMVVKN